MSQEFKNEVDLSVSKGMIAEAKRGLAWREEHGRGATQVGFFGFFGATWVTAAVARQIIRNEGLSERTWKRVYSFFSRPEVDKKAEGFSPGEKGYPSNGRIAWACWGGDSGFARAKKIVAQLDKDD